MNTITIAPNETELQESGFTAAAEQLTKEKALAQKLRIAFEHFRVVTPEHIERFNKDLKERTGKDEGKNQYGTIQSYDRLAFALIASYKSVPPREVLSKLREAKALGCFDSFEVATIESVRIVPGPILFGTITGCGNKYFIAQWDDDVKIEQILRENEG